MPRDEEKRNDLLIGRNAVTEALKSGRDIDSLYLAKGNNNPALLRLASMAKERGAVVKETDPKKLDYMCSGGNHLGIAAYVAVHEYSTVDDILQLARDRDGRAGVHGVIIPKRRSASLSYAVGKTSAGAVEYMKIARVSNLAATIDELKQKGVWIYAADMDGEDYKSADVSGAAALVIGSEGKGIGKLIKSKCDAVLSLPVKGRINSLNASVAAGILMYEISSKR